MQPLAEVYVEISLDRTLQLGYYITNLSPTNR